jgi:hypothetical protein
MMYILINSGLCSWPITTTIAHCKKKGNALDASQRGEFERRANCGQAAEKQGARFSILARIGGFWGKAQIQTTIF